MAKNALWFLAVVLAALIQTTWPDTLKLQEVLPDLSLLLVVYFAIVDGEERAMFTGVLGGIYQDVASSAVLGHHVLCLIVVGYVVGRFSTRLITEHPAVKAGLVLCASVLHGLLFTAILYVQQPDIRAMYTIVTSVIPGAFYTALLTPLVFMILARAFRRHAGFQGGLT